MYVERTAPGGQKVTAWSARSQPWPETTTECGQGMEQELGTPLGCQHVCIHGVLPTAQDLPHGASALCMVLPSKKKTAGVLWCQNFLTRCCGGGFAHLPVDLGPYISQEYTCTTLGPLWPL